MNVLECRLKAYNPDNNCNYMVVELLVDGQLIADFGYYATDFKELFNSISESGSYFILKCWCGQPECVGIHKGIEVKHEKNKVYWNITMPEPSRRYAFNQEQYTKAIESCITQGKKTLKKKQQYDTNPTEITPDRNKPFFSLE